MKSRSSRSFTRVETRKDGSLEGDKCDEVRPSIVRFQRLSWPSHPASRLENRRIEGLTPIGVFPSSAVFSAIMVPALNAVV